MNALAQLNQKIGTAGAIVMIFIMTGCAAPTVRWQSPTQVQVPDYTIEYGIAYANSARDAYHKAIDTQTAATTSLGAGLIGLGGVIAGLATFGAHRDALIGAALLGGTGYALGNWGYDKRRPIIYQSGVEGLNCAVRAVIPFYMTRDDLQALNVAVVELEGQIPGVNSAVDDLRKQIAGVPAENARRKAAEILIVEANRKVDAARAAVATARGFAVASRRAGPELVAAVDRIGAAVDKALLDTIPDLSAVPKIVGGLAGLAGAFAPGAGVETRIASKFADFKPQGLEEVAGDVKAAAIDNAMLILQRRLDTMTTSTGTVQARLAGYDTAASTGRLADCGVTTVDTALKLSTTRVELQATKDMSFKVIVTGGTPPYSASLIGARPDGLSVHSPLLYDSVVEILSTKSLTETQTFQAMVTDATKPPKSQTIEIVVSPAGAPPANAASQESKPTGVSSQAFVDEIKKLAAWNSTNPVMTFKVVPEKTEVSKGGDVIVTVSCASEPKNPFKSRDLNTAFRTQFADAPAFKPLFSKIPPLTFTADNPKCVQKDAASSAPKIAVLRPGPTAAQVRSASLSPLEISSIQRNLCLPEDSINGHWGPLTRKALSRWRSEQSWQWRKLDMLTVQEVAALYSSDPRNVPVQCKVS